VAAQLCMLSFFSCELYSLRTNLLLLFVSSSYLMLLHCSVDGFTVDAVMRDNNCPVDNVM